MTRNAQNIERASDIQAARQIADHASRASLLRSSIGSGVMFVRISTAC